MGPIGSDTGIGSSSGSMTNSRIGLPISMAPPYSAGARRVPNIGRGPVTTLDDHIVATYRDREGHSMKMSIRGSFADKEAVLRRGADTIGNREFLGVGQPNYHEEMDASSRDPLRPRTGASINEARVN